MGTGGLSLQEEVVPALQALSSLAELREVVSAPDEMLDRLLAGHLVHASMDGQRVPAGVASVFRQVGSACPGGGGQRVPPGVVSVSRQGWSACSAGVVSVFQRPKAVFVPC